MNSFKYFDRFFACLNQDLNKYKPKLTAIKSNPQKNIWERLSCLFKRECPPIFLEYI